MKKVCVLLLFLVAFVSNATKGKDGDLTVTGNQVVNYFTGLTAVNTVSGVTLTVSNIADLDDSAGIYASAGLSTGDLIMLYQAQGASFTNNSNTAAYGAFNLNSAGRYEIYEVISVTGNDVLVAENGSLCNANNLIYSYELTQTQVIRVPQFDNLTIGAGNSIITPAWNGSRGGVVAIDVNDTLNVNGQINAAARGFRGGVIDNQTTASGTNVTLYTGAAEVDGAEKGESILGFQTVYNANNGRFGRGAPANGGGGGTAHNAGGGGGANGNNGVAWSGQGNPNNTPAGWSTAWNLDPTLNSTTTSSGGGRGGYTYGSSNQDTLTVAPGTASWGGNSRRERGGLGGRPVPFDDVGRLFFGGGGGAGDGNNGRAGGGGTGGGLIYIITNNLAGNGTINTNGQIGFNTANNGGNNDAPGGGGAGGTIVISANSTAATVNLSAIGGKGGDQLAITNENEGPGGGGGVISISGGTGIPSANGGANGITQSTALTEFLANGATVGAGGQPNEVTSLVTDLPICLAGADVQVNKNLTSSGPYIAGSTVTYSITVTNNGSLTATNIQVTDTPSNLTINSVSSTNCSAFPCTIPSLINGASEVISVSATINATGSFDNSTTVTADHPDSDTSNNTDNSGNNGTAGISADMQVVKNLTSTGPYVTGDSVTYSITVTNNGPDDATNVQVTDSPTNLTITSVSSTNCTAFTCTIGAMASGASEVITVTATIDASGAFDNATTVSADETDPVSSNNQDNTGNNGTAGTSADMAITKNLDTAGPYNSGQNIQYTLVVTNNGPNTANNVVVTDTPTNLTITSVSSTSCSAFPCTIPSLVNGGSESITVMATINSSGTFDNATTVAADETDPDLSNNQDNTGNGGSVNAVVQPVPGLNLYALILLILLMSAVVLPRRLR